MPRRGPKPKGALAQVPKLAVLLVLLGEKEDDTCTERRPEACCLLDVPAHVGDASCGGNADIWGVLTLFLRGFCRSPLRAPDLGERTHEGTKFVWRGLSF